MKTNQKYKVICWLQKYGVHIEHWKQIKSFPSYEVSTEGSIRNIITGQLLKPEIKNTHSPRVNLNGQRLFISDIVVSTFLSDSENINYYYKDGNNQNTKISNLVILPEDFEELKDFSEYMVNPFGIIYSKKMKKIINPICDKTGSYRVWLCHNGDYRNYSVGKLVAKQFISNPNNFRYVEHIDGNKSNNSDKNLVWSKFPEDNKQYWLKSTNTKLKTDDLPLIKKMDSVGISKRKIAAVFDVSVDTIIAFLSNKTWKDFS